MNSKEKAEENSNTRSSRRKTENRIEAIFKIVDSYVDDR